MSVFFGFALADSMLPEGNITKVLLSNEQARKVIQAGVVPCLNPSHEATIHAMRSRFGIEVQIPAAPPQVRLVPGDSLIVMGVRGLPRLTDRHEYTEAEVAQATFEFSLYVVESKMYRGFVVTGYGGGGGAVIDCQQAYTSAEQAWKDAVALKQTCSWSDTVAGVNPV